MSDINQVYHPLIIPDVPFPQDQGVAQQVFTVQTSQIGQPSPTIEPTSQLVSGQGFPDKRVAYELLTTALNTKALTIGQPFTFTPSGALQIGNYELGVSGDIRISPAGIIARDSSGNTTFTLDGDTGDGTFSGQIRASSFENDFFSVDPQGNVIAQSIIIASNSFLSSAQGANILYTSTTPTDVTGSSFTITLARNTIVLIIVSFTGWCQPSGAGDWDARGIIRLLVDGTDIGRGIISGGKSGTDQTGSVDGNRGLMTGGYHYLTPMTIGSHTIKLTGAADGTQAEFNLYHFRISYITIGNY